MTALSFEPAPQLHPRRLSAVARQQLEMYGERLDGERLSAEARLDPKNDGAGLLFTPTRWKAVGHPEGILTRLLTATSDEDARGQTGATGAPLAMFSSPPVGCIAAVLATVPRDAVDQRRKALAAAITEEDYRSPPWLEEKLERLRKVVQTRAPLIVRVV
jgi:hypothetical protein